MRAYTRVCAMVQRSQILLVSVLAFIWSLGVIMCEAFGSTWAHGGEEGGEQGGGTQGQKKAALERQQDIETRVAAVTCKGDQRGRGGRLLLACCCCGLFASTFACAFVVSYRPPRPIARFIKSLAPGVCGGGGREGEGEAAGEGEGESAHCSLFPNLARCTRALSYQTSLLHWPVFPHVRQQCSAP